MAKVVIYSMNSCPYCTMAKRLLTTKGAKYEEIEVNSRAMWDEVEEKTGRSTVPQIFIDEHHVGGYDDLVAADKRGEIDPLLQG